MFNNSDDDDDDIPSFLRPDFTVTYDNDEEIENLSHKIETLWLRRDVNNLTQLLSHSTEITLSNEIKTSINLILYILSGNHLSFFRYDDSTVSLCISFIRNAATEQTIRESIYNDYNLTIDKKAYCLKLLVISTLLLEIYMQVNYTGPELSSVDMNTIFLSTSTDISRDTSFKYAIEQLECDGIYPFHSICQLPQCLYISRCLYILLLDPTRGYWRQGVIIDTYGKLQIPAYPNPNTQNWNSFYNNSRYLTTKEWRCSRSSVIHLRLLQTQSYEHVPTLWKECSECFTIAIQQYGKSMSHIETYQQALLYLSQYNTPHDNTHDNNNANVQSSKVIPENTVETYITSSGGSEVYSDAMIESQLWLEWGLCQHYFEYKNKVSRVFYIV